VGNSQARFSGKQGDGVYFAIMLAIFATMQKGQKGDCHLSGTGKPLAKTVTVTFPS
jgi:hypothetical protein